jgi:hypothetical protein
MTETIQRIINEKGNSYEFGKAGNRFKLYFNTSEDLESQIKALATIGLIKPEENPLNQTQLNKMEGKTNGNNN